MKTKHVQHLYWRAGFGIYGSNLISESKKKKPQVIDELFKSSVSCTPLKVETPEIDAYIGSMDSYDKKKFMDFNKMSNRKAKEHNEVWLNRLITSDELLRERMTLFWANHFVCRDNHIYHIQQYNNTLRKHALGNFGDFVKAISREASMIKYLNNKQNVKERPNENYGRELMELFTLGEGHYSESDIKSAARAFTGWNANFKGEFIIRRGKHDSDEKEFFGETGNFGGDDIVDIILKQRQCAKFVCTKIYKSFVNENVNDSHIEKMTAIFYKDYNIENLMRFVFMSNWFYDKANIGTKIKSPIELLVGINKVVPVSFDNKRGLMYIQNIMGQTLLRPPNVAGWKGGKSWIDANTIMIRLKLPSVILNDAVIALEEKGEFEETYDMYYERVRKQRNYLKTSPDWNSFDASFKDLTNAEMKDSLILSEISEGTKKMLSKLEIDDKRDYCIQLMSIPEYQMC